MTAPPLLPNADRPGLRKPFFRIIPAGSFLMGENDEDKFANDTERPRHRVTIAAPFGLAACAVSNAEFRVYRPGWAAGEPEDWPVVGVSWSEAKAYAGWLNERTGLASRLPSEAEWEYACRAGSEEIFSGGSTLEVTQANFFYSENGQRIGVGSRVPGGRYPANAFGLHDMHGNVCEWTEDVWHPQYHGAPVDGSAWTDGGRPGWRVIRGGAWDYLPRLLRSAWRDALPEEDWRDNVGFRLACDL